MRVRTVCVDVEQKKAKLNNRTWLNGLLTIGEHQKFLEEGKSIVGGASVAYVVLVSHLVSCPDYFSPSGKIVECHYVPRSRRAPRRTF